VLIDDPAVAWTAGDEVHLWLVPFEPGGEAKGAERFLTARERVRLDGFRNVGARSQFLAARAGRRLILAGYTNASPQALQFRRGDAGKPFASRPEALRPLSFNLSHTTKLVALVVAWKRRVGIDVELASREVDAMSFARRFLSQREVAALEREARSARRAAFYRIWTLKEAYLKALGVGLSVPLDSFSVSLAPGGRLGVEDDGVPDADQLWRLFCYEYPSNHVVSLCIEAARGEVTPVVRVRRASLQELERRADATGATGSPALETGSTR